MRSAGSSTICCQKNKWTKQCRPATANDIIAQGLSYLHCAPYISNTINNVQSMLFFEEFSKTERKVKERDTGTEKQFMIVS